MVRYLTLENPKYEICPISITVVYDARDYLHALAEIEKRESHPVKGAIYTFNIQQYYDNLPKKERLVIGLSVAANRGSVAHDIYPLFAMVKNQRKPLAVYLYSAQGSEYTVDTLEQLNRLFETLR